jgi:protein TonB
MSDISRVKAAFFLCLAPGIIATHAQEPALFSPGLAVPIHAVRYEENPGYFHYVVPCRQFAGGKLEPALCWPVNAIRLRMVDGKLEQSAMVSGTLTVSATQVRFIPQNQQDMEFSQAIAISEVSYTHQPGHGFAILGGKDQGFEFGFVNFCAGCQAGAAPLGPAAQLEPEFSNVADSLQHFDSFYGRIRDLAREIRLTIGPVNQPTPEDPGPAMELYATLNQRLAEVCAEPARSCLRSYQAYQACESGASPANCGAPPSCTASCTLAPDVYHGLNAGACESPAKDSLALYPNWEDALKREDAEHPPATPACGPGVVGMSGMGSGGIGGVAGILGTPAPPPTVGIAQYPGWMTLRGMPDQLLATVDYPSQTSDGSCKARQVYDLVKARHSSRQPPILLAGFPPPPPPPRPSPPHKADSPYQIPKDIRMIKEDAAPPNCVVGGVAGMAALGLATPPPVVQRVAAKPTGPQSVSSGVISGLLLTHADPVYPAVAKAAHIQGVVVLHALISKQGTIEDLQVISGPPLLTGSAIDAVKNWTYRPFIMNGEPAEVDTTINVNFTFSGI